MRVLVAPDAFDGALSAVEAARAIAEGWSTRAPADDVRTAPLSAGGPGFVDVLHASLGGELLARTVRGPFTGPSTQPVPATILRVGDTAYVEAAQACGLHLTGGRRGAETTSYGVGELVRAAADEVGDTGEVVVGLGGLGVHDGGAGLLAALGAQADVPLDAGVDALAGVGRVDLDPARGARGATLLRAACDDATVLAGLFGTTKAAGERRGISPERLPGVDAVLEAWGTATDRRTALTERTGAGGGLGHGLALLGAELVDGLGLVADRLDLAGLARGCEVVLTGEASLDFSGASGRVASAAARVAADVLAPCVVIAGQVVLGRRELRAQGIEAAYAVAEVAGEDRLRTEPAAALAATAGRVARTWSL